MTITYECTLNDFDFWGQAHENFKKLTDTEIAILDDYFDCITYNRTDFNDLFAYYFDKICAFLDLDEDEVLARH